MRIFTNLHFSLVFNFISLQTQVYCFFFFSLSIVMNSRDIFCSAEFFLRHNYICYYQRNGFTFVSLRVVTYGYRRSFQMKVLFCKDRNISYRIRYFYWENLWNIILFRSELGHILGRCGPKSKSAEKNILEFSR